MEFFIIIGVLAFIVWGISNANKNENQQQDKWNKNATDFQVNISQTVETIEKDLIVDFFEVKIRGAIKAFSDNQTVKFIAKMYDETDGEKEPVLSNVEEFQSDDSIVFSFQKSEKLPYADSLISDWMTVFKIPLLFLEFPKKGNRNISIVFMIVNQQGNILEKASHEISFFNKENGYCDLAENRKKFEEIVIKTALLVSNSDNEMDSNEADVIKHWVKTRLTGYDENIRDESKRRLNGYIRRGFSQIKNNEINVHGILDEIHDIARGCSHLR